MFQVGHPGYKKAGTKNRINLDIRQQVMDTFDKMGEHKDLTGAQFFLSWARKNPKSFYTGIFVKICPAQLDITDNRQHESFIDRMAQTMLEAEAKVIDSKLIESQSQSPMGKDAIILPPNGGHMGNDDIDKEVKHPIIKGECEEVVSSDEVEG